MTNPIIQEVRQAREELAARFDFDLHRILTDAIARQRTRPTVNRQANPVTPVNSPPPAKISHNICAPPAADAPAFA
jgi:hypothetical protein